MAWSQVCKSKVEGGLGIHDCDKWNKATIGKLIWNIASKLDSLWVKWVHHNYLKGQSFWVHSPPVDATWAWKKLCKVGVLFASAYNGDRWTKTSTGKYTIKIGYTWLVSATTNVEWHRWVWNNFNIPRHSMVCWMMALDKIITKDKLKNLDICPLDVCVVCGVGRETKEHLPFECHYSRVCVQGLRDAKIWTCRQTNAMKTANWIRRRFKGSRFKRKVSYAVLTATVYRIWTNRNKVFWENKCENPIHTVSNILDEVKGRILSVQQKKLSANERDWLMSLKIV